MAPLMSICVDMRPFRERLKEAAKHIGVEYSQTAIARSLGISKQTVDQWMAEVRPSAEMIYLIADKWKVEPRWLQIEQGEMVAHPSAKADLGPDEQILLTRFRSSDPRWQIAIKYLAYVATEEQLEVASEVNMIIAKALGKHPRDIKPIGDTRMREILQKSPQGFPPKGPTNPKPGQRAMSVAAPESLPPIKRGANERNQNQRMEEPRHDPSSRKTARASKRR